MENVSRLQVIGLRRYDFDGNRGAQIFCAQAADGTNPDVIGMDVMQFNAPYSLLDTIDPKAVPGEFECQLFFKRGAGGKGVTEIHAMRQIKAEKPAAAPRG